MKRLKTLVLIISLIANISLVIYVYHQKTETEKHLQKIESLQVALANQQELAEVARMQAERAQYLARQMQLEAEKDERE